MPSPSDDQRGSDVEETHIENPSSTFHPGDVLCGRFRVERFIARGGMGELYAARDLTLGELVALKTVRPEVASNPRIHQRFLREVQLARKVTHPNICRIFDLFQHIPSEGAANSAPISFVTMELLNGETLAKRLKRTGRFPPDRALPLVEQMVAALSAAHAAGVVHRDFKSNNVMLLDAGSGDAPRVVVTDFGLAYSLLDANADDSAPLSVAGELMGTPDYMAPEQIQGGAVTPATDIYALGIVLYEIVTGVRPFSAETRLAAVLNRISGPPPTPPHKIVADLPRAWNDAIERCLARSPEDRFASADDVIGALGARTAPARRSWVGAVAAALALAAVGLAAWNVLNEDSPLSDVPGAATSLPMRLSVAVLGFRDLTGREDTGWLSTALAEMLSAELAAGDSLRAIPGETVHRMKADLALADADSYAAATLARIRENLGSDLVVSGSYVTVGGGETAELRVDVRLQDARAGETIDVITETGRSAELFDVVSRAGSRLRRRLGVEPALQASASVRASLPASRDAARLYTEGLNRLRSLDALGARERFEQAIEAEPQFPLAHSALAASWAALGYDNRAREAAERALALATSLPRAERLQVEAVYREMASSWSEAIALWQSLATFSPDDVEHVLRLANVQIRSGAAMDALATVEGFRARFPDVKDPRLDLAEARAAETLSDFVRMVTAAGSAATLGVSLGARGLVADARLVEGGALTRQGRFDDAMLLFEQARAIYEEIGDRGGVARTLNSMGAAVSNGSDQERAIALYEEGLGIARAIGNQDLVARLLNNLAIQERRAGDYQASLAMNRESLRIREELGDRTNAAVSLNNIGNVLLDMGDFDGASRHYEQSAEMSREIGDRRGLARALRNAAEALMQQGDLARARSLNEEALEIRRGIDDPASVSSSLYALGTILALEGNLPDAKRELAESLEIDQRLGAARGAAFALFQLGDIALVEGNLAEARRLHEEALDIRMRLGERGTAAESRTALAILALEEERPDEAETLAQEAADALADLTFPAPEAQARAALARTLLAQDRLGDARREIVRAGTLVANPQHVIARLPVAITAARIDARTDPAAALQALETLGADAASRSLVRWSFEARRAIVEIEEARSPAAARSAREALRRDASASGLLLYAR